MGGTRVSFGPRPCACGGVLNKFLVMKASEHSARTDALYRLIEIYLFSFPVYAPGMSLDDMFVKV